MEKNRRDGEELVQQPAAHSSSISADYEELLSDIKTRIAQARVRALLSVNRELVLLYWSIGRDILLRQKEEGWGTKVIERLSHDIKAEFPRVKGFSARNLKYMRYFADSYSDSVFVQQFAALIPWFHNCTILDKVKDQKEREWYIQATIENGWSRAVLVYHIESGLYGRQGKALTNFVATLPAHQSELASENFKDPYIFDFLALGTGMKERELEMSLTDHVQKFLMELGSGFAFVGRQVHMDVGGQDYYLDLLFYHLTLRCYVIVDLKVTDFKPEFAGKMNFYLSAVDDIMRHPQDAPSIGLILCKDKNRITVEYALRNTTRPMGVAAYELTRSLPKEYAKSLPTIVEIEREIAK